MSTIGSVGTGNSTVGYLRLSSASRAPLVTTRASNSIPSGPSIHELLAQLSTFRNALDTWESTVRFGRRGQGTGQPGETALSASTLSLQAEATAATLGSTEEINTEVTTEFSPTDPSFTGTSTSDPTVAGAYDGSLGTTTLTVEVKNGGAVGVSNVVLDVYDGGTKVATVPYNVAAGQTVDLVAGLTLSLSIGTAEKGDSFAIDVTVDGDAALDPSAAFDGSGGDPGFESGFRVVDGSFEVNGVSIAVATSDSLQDVLDRIGASEAGVTAAYDAGTESVVFTQNTAGAAPTIALANDTSGLLAALKLDGATVTPGTDGAPERAIADVPSLSGVSTGSFRVNGVDLFVDVTIDSLQDVLTRINGSGAGVTATYDETSDRVRIESNDPAADFQLENGTSGLFSALDIEARVYESGSGEEERRLALRDRRSFERQIERVARELAALFEGEYEGLAAGTAARVRSTVKSAVFSALSDTLGTRAAAQMETELGIRFDFEAEGADPLLVFDEEEFRSALFRSPEKVAELLLGSESSGSAGLVGELRETVRRLENDLLAERRADAAASQSLNLLA